MRDNSTMTDRDTTTDRQIMNDRDNANAANTADTANAANTIDDGARNRRDTMVDDRDRRDPMVDDRNTPDPQFADGRNSRDAGGRPAMDRGDLAEDRRATDATSGSDGRSMLHTDDLLRHDNGRNGDQADRRGHAGEESRPALFSNPGEYRHRWEAIQAGFVDEPRRAVENADALVAEVIQQLVRSFADERSQLETQWSRGDQASTEDLRVALRRYRSFFDRLLSA
jgi:hypothetical protein